MAQQGIHHEDGRFYLRTGEEYSELLYRVEGNVMSIYHTFVPEKERGHGVAAKLVERAFSFAIKRGLMVRPDCTYVMHYLDTHTELRKYAV